MELERFSKMLVSYYQVNSPFSSSFQNSWALVSFAFPGPFLAALWLPSACPLTTWQVFNCRAGVLGHSQPSAAASERAVHTARSAQAWGFGEPAAGEEGSLGEVEN